MKYLADPAYHTPSPVTANIPPIDPDMVSGVMKEVPPPTKGPLPETPTGPDLSNPRIAWMFQALKEGTHIKQIMKDDNYERVDPATMFSQLPFSPTYFIHGSADTSVSPEFSRRAFTDLKAAGNESHLVIIEGAGHGFDNNAKPEDEYCVVVCEGLEWLRGQV